MSGLTASGAGKGPEPDVFGTEARTKSGIPFSLKEERGTAGDEPPTAPKLRAEASKETAEGGQGGTDEAAKKKEAPGIADMIPLQLRPAAFGGVLAYGVFTLFKQAVAVGDISWVRPGDMRGMRKLDKTPQKRVEVSRGDGRSVYAARRQLGCCLLPLLWFM